MSGFRLKFITVIFSVLIVFAFCPAVRARADIVDSGKCGENVDWSLDDAGTLTISGSGEMYNWNYWTNGYDDVPWAGYYDSIKSVVFKGNVTKIGDLAFAHCRSLKSFTVPDSVSVIGKGAFYGCSNLKRVTIPEGVTTLGDSVFWDCTKLDNVTIPSSVTSLGARLFLADTGLTNVTINANITTLGREMFMQCYNLTSVTLPDTLKVVDEYAFYSCWYLPEIDLPSGITVIGKNAFSNCYDLPSIALPESLTSIGNRAFSGCRSLTKISLPGKVTTIGEFAFVGCENVTRVYIPNSVTSIGRGAFCGCDCLNNVTIPDSVTEISDSLFNGCVSLTKISLPDTITRIGNHAFEKCVSLKHITIPDGVTVLAPNLFRGCTGLKTFTIREGITEIGNLCFYQCTNLKSVTIPLSMKRISQSAFDECESLADVYYDDTREKMSWITVFDNTRNPVEKNIFEVFGNAKIHFPLEITDHPSDYYGSSGHKAEFKVTAKGTGVKYRWQTYKDGKWVNSSFAGARTTTLSVDITRARDGYRFRCIVTDSANRKTISDTAYLHVVDPVTITSQPKDYTGKKGSTATFRVKAEGTDLKYQWQTYKSGGWVDSSLAGAKTNMLSVPVINSRDGYRFRCVVTDRVGNKAISGTAVLHVTGAVSITKEPDDYYGSVGTTATFKVVAKGEGLKYQWQTYKDGQWVNSSLPGAKTAVLTLDVTSSRDGYKFRCVITDAAGIRVISRTVTLHVENSLLDPPNNASVSSPARAGVIEADDITTAEEDVENAYYIDKDDSVESVAAGIDDDLDVAEEPVPAENPESTGAGEESASADDEGSCLQTDITGSDDGLQYGCSVNGADNGSVSSDDAVDKAF